MTVLARMYFSLSNYRSLMPCQMLRDDNNDIDSRVDKNCCSHENLMIMIIIMVMPVIMMIIVVVMIRLIW